jgi:hypothetical protein
VPGELVDRMKRHADQTGHPYLPVSLPARGVSVGASLLPLSSWRACAMAQPPGVRACGRRAGPRRDRHGTGPDRVIGQYEEVDKQLLGWQHSG